MFESFPKNQVSVAELVGTKLGLINLGAGFDSHYRNQFFERTWYIGCATVFQAVEASSSLADRSSLEP